MIEAEKWKVKRNDTVIGQVLRFEQGIEQAKVTSTSLDGTIYIQTIGSGVNYADVTILCSLSERKLLNKAEADGADIYVVYRNTIYVGYIKEAPSWTTIYPGEWYSAEIKLLIDEEITG